MEVIFVLEIVVVSISQSQVTENQRQTLAGRAGNTKYVCALLTQTEKWMFEPESRYTNQTLFSATKMYVVNFKMKENLLHWFMLQNISSTKSFKLRQKIQ